MVAAIQADHQIVRRYAEKYSQLDRTSASLLVDMFRKIGFQMMVAYRVMRFFHASRIPAAPMVVSRLMRHAYGSDIHWEAQFEPGVAIVHGMGLCIARGARVASGVVLFQGVTLGESASGDSRTIGSPTLEPDVHVGPGVTIIGPVTIGAASKIMAGCVVTRSIPPASIVEAPVAVVRARVSAFARAAAQ